MVRRKHPNFEIKSEKVSISNTIAVTPTIKKDLYEACASEYYDTYPNTLFWKWIRKELKLKGRDSFGEKVEKECFNPVIKKWKKLKKEEEKNEL